MSAIAATTGGEIQNLCHALSHRGARIANVGGNGWAAGLLGREGESKILSENGADLVCSGFISFPPDIIPLLQENLQKA